MRKHSDSVLSIDIQHENTDLSKRISGKLRYAIRPSHNYNYAEFVLLNFILFRIGIMAVSKFFYPYPYL